MAPASGHHESDAHKCNMNTLALAAATADDAGDGEPGKREHDMSHSPSIPNAVEKSPSTIDIPNANKCIQNPSDLASNDAFWAARKAVTDAERDVVNMTRLATDVEQQVIEVKAELYLMELQVKALTDKRDQLQNSLAATRKGRADAVERYGKAQEAMQELGPLRIGTDFGHSRHLQQSVFQETEPQQQDQELSGSSGAQELSGSSGAQNGAFSAFSNTARRSSGGAIQPSKGFKNVVKPDVGSGAQGTVFQVKNAARVGHLSGADSCLRPNPSDCDASTRMHVADNAKVLTPSFENKMHPEMTFIELDPHAQKKASAFS